MAGQRRLWFPLFTCGAILALAGVRAGELPPPASAPIDFQRDVQPIFAQRCYACHGPALQTSGFRLDDGEAALKGGNSGPAIKPGDSASSALILRTARVAGQIPMPPAGAALT